MKMLIDTDTDTDKDEEKTYWHLNTQKARDSTTSTYKTIGERFSYYDVIIINSASDPSIQNAMNVYNYTAEEIASGKALLENARKADATCYFPHFHHTLR